MVRTCAALAFALAATASWAADTPAAAATPAEAAAAARPAPGEPAVRQTVIEDDTTRIDELRVRGQLQRIVVTTKGTKQSYEILTGDGSRDLGFAANTSRGAAGRRVWNVLQF
ncbi:hypothetical protein [Piscinibacter koreensis]|uniref:DUF2782 domain-containing protein n=1 Tax=Piscinibacter koreensis TaxID=2742824 RepID=A0A7Y6NLI1_9BURK|nr:hypothetical protein [Schlegelella koreensis]NUZ05413.1 hypothetical protein [Schlegelella koreensis]